MSDLLDRLPSLPTRPPGAAAALGATAVIVPHPDDESLGCGGLLALLRRAGQPVRVALVSDGAMSHPHAPRHGPAERRALRERELREALGVLGVDPAPTLTLGLPDGRVPDHGDSFDEAAARLRAWLLGAPVATLLVPWRHDPHPDHRASFALARAAASALAARRLEYLVWGRARAEEVSTELPCSRGPTGWRLDISSVLPLKERAIAAHRSQHPGGPLDDPTGFTLPPALLARSREPFEIFLESTDDDRTAP